MRGEYPDNRVIPVTFAIFSGVKGKKRLRQIE